MTKTTLADRIIAFNEQLQLDVELPERISVMNPFNNDGVKAVCREFYKKYYDDNKKRILLLGINPGRFGAGVTGIPFTDPVRLQEKCGISNGFVKRPELSSDFIYQMIDRFGGPAGFYARYLISAVSPLGFVKNGKNLNYYDDKVVKHAVEPFILWSLRQHLSFGIKTDTVICLGEGENYNYLQKLNKREGLFKEIIPLAHPRFIMQYRRKKLQDYLDTYYKTLSLI
ncbi:MAG: DUF4918 family protein [Bacteroidales bacterium]|nr:DUF4918 family protein [Bacteroidales bacterium]